MTRPHRILFVIGSLDVGGTQRHLVQMVAALDRRRWQPAVYCLVEKGPLAGELEARGVPVRAPRLGGGNVGPRRSLLRRGWRLCCAMSGLMAELVFRRPAIVHFFLPESYVVGAPCARAAFCRKLVMSRRSLNIYQSRRPFLIFFERRLHRHMARIIGNSHAVVNELRAEGVTDEKLRLIYNGIDLAPFATSPAKAEAQQRLGIPPDGFVMLLIANIIPYKGHADLLVALGQIKNRLPAKWRLLCAGLDYGSGAALRAQAAQLGIDGNITWLGVRNDIGALTAAADLGLLVSHEEGFSNAILEGMAAGLPMIVTDVGGNAEAVLDGETGLVVPARESAHLAAAILALATNPTRAAAMGKAGRERVECKFSLASCVREYEVFYAELISADDLA